MSASNSDNASLNVTELLLNTTEQILQRINDLLAEAKEQNTEYNWDPATFAVTFIIGIIATFFAGLAIVQSLLASGPGRLKCGRYALGPWSQLTERKFDWHELRFRTVAYTPIISWDAMDSQRRKYEQLDSDFSICDRAFPFTSSVNRMYPKRSLRKALHEFFPSSWLALLSRIRVDHPALWTLKATGADFIPTELPSVLAYGNIRDVINLVLIASKEVIQLELDGESHLRLVQASDISLSFRIHPLLGLVGSFEQYETVVTSERGRGSNLPAAMDIALGSSHMQTAWLLHALPWSNVGSDEETFALWNFFSQLTTGLCQCQATESDPALLAASMAELSVSSFLELTSELVDAGLHRFFLLCDFKPPDDGPMVFPRGSSSMLHILQPFLVQSNFWLQGLSCYEDPPASDLCQHLLAKDNFRTRLVERIDSNGSSIMMIHDKVFSSCCRYLASLSSRLEQDNATSRALSMLYFDREKTTLKEKGAVRIAQSMLKVQINEIEKWMFKVNQNAWSCRVRTMSVLASLTHLALGEDMAEKSAITPDAFGFQDDDMLSSNQTETAPLESFLYSCVPKYHRQGLRDALRELQDVWEQVAGSKHLRGIDAKNPLDDLLIYRIILSAMLLELAIDNSAVVDNKVYDRVIPIL